METGDASFPSHREVGLRVSLRIPTLRASLLINSRASLPEVHGLRASRVLCTCCNYMQAFVLYMHFLGKALSISLSKVMCQPKGVNSCQW